ncbi:MAG: hypothetical protein ACLTMP_05675 [Eggerthella lenta]
MSVGLRIDDLIASLQRCACRAASSSPSPWCFATFPAADEFRKISATMRLRGVELSRNRCCIPAARAVRAGAVSSAIKIADDLAARHDAARPRGGARRTATRMGVRGARDATVLVCTAGYVAWAVGVL